MKQTFEERNAELNKKWLERDGKPKKQPVGRNLQIERRRLYSDGISNRFKACRG